MADETQEKSTVDPVTGTETTGHEWDGIRELDTPMPRWWLWTFLATVIFAVVYTILMPAWPLVNTYTKGLLGYSQRATVANELAEAEAAKEAVKSDLLAAEFQAIESTPRLLTFAMAAGEAAFGDNCAPCHGSGGQGAPGYPNLIDDAWLWGGSYEAVHETIRVGIRSDHPRTRFSEMPAFGQTDVLSRDAIRDVTHYVLALSGQAHDADRAARGEEVYAQQCAVCHGPDGTGMAPLGAPDLTDPIWLYGGDEAAIMKTVANARNSVMPAWDGRLDAGTIKSLAVYVHSLGGGQ